MLNPNLKNESSLAREEGKEGGVESKTNKTKITMRQFGRSDNNIEANIPDEKIPYVLVRCEECALSNKAEGAKELIDKLSISYY